MIKFSGSEDDQPRVADALSNLRGEADGPPLFRF